MEQTGFLAPLGRARTAAIGVALCTGLAAIAPARADEGGLGFWVPGYYGSLAATPTAPGFSFTSFSYHATVSSETNLNRGFLIAVGLEGSVDFDLFGPNYTFEDPVLGGQLMLSVATVFGDIVGSVSATLTGPNGDVTLTLHRQDEVTGWGDILPQATLKWNDGTDNYMVYLTGAIPVGVYDPNRLVNIGLGHGAIDGGFGYTYLDKESGWEYSAVLGATFNLENHDTNYQSGVDIHLDAAVSRFVQPDLHLGVVGYAYSQAGSDTGGAAFLGDFRSHVFALGPQAGYIFPIADDTEGYLNLRGYSEFGAVNRPQGWALWLTFSIGPKSTSS